MRILKHMDHAYRVTERDYKDYLRAIVEGKDPDIATYGRNLGEIEPVTDLTPDEAKEMLEDL